MKVFTLGLTFGLGALVLGAAACHEKPKGPPPVGSVVETVPAKCTSTGVVGNGEITRSTREAKGFDDIFLSGYGDVDVKEGPDFEVVVETDSNVQKLVQIEMTRNRVFLRTSGTFCTNKLHYIVTLPLLKAAKVEGSGKMDLTKTTPASDVALAVTGSGKLVFRGAADDLEAFVNGSGTIELDQGQAKKTKGRIMGSGTIKKASFVPGSVSKDNSGSGVIDL